MSKKKIGIIIAVVVAIAAAAGGGAWYLLKGNGGNGSSADKVFVSTVSSLNSSNSGAQNRYSGVVEAQESWSVNKDGEREIKEVFVKEGDMVEKGTPLFEYDMDEVKAEISQAQLDLEGMQNEITDYQNQIDQLSRERNSVPEEDRFEYTAEIQEKENSIKQSQYNIESKKAEIQKKQETIDNAVVKSKLAGVLKSINESGGDSMSGEEEAYMTVLAVGDFRVKGTVSETNVQMLSEEQSVILRSRIDEEQTWNGTITKIDTQNELANESNDMYIDESEGGEKATKYPFYVKLESTDGLIMGQHLFIELDEGQTEEKEGLWLFEGYIVQEDEAAFVWVANENSKLEKRTIELGEYDENKTEYEIVSGLSEKDLIAFPMEGLYEGVTTVTDAEEVDYDSPLYNQEGEEEENPDGSEDEEDGEGEDSLDGEEASDNIPMTDMMEGLKDNVVQDTEADNGTDTEAGSEADIDSGNEADTEAEQE